MAPTSAASTSALSPTTRGLTRRLRKPLSPPLVPLAASNHHGLGIRGAPLSISAAHQGLDSRLRFDAAAAAEGMAAEASAAAEIKPFAVLFVCLGNICRSPAAEAVFRNLSWHQHLRCILWTQGNKADSRMRSASKKRGIEVTSISRPLRPSDFRDFDLILAMDRQNYEDILNAFERWRHKEPLPDNAANKVKLMCSYCKTHTESEVPDPYYGGPKGFEKVSSLTFANCSKHLNLGSY
ncbi:hypothetical protein PR202_gb02386 [Eleusine coracana subsp. coracana]|uniref:acid phosphatase n=1 Tax=Eleusine coracana subsp. coracana TaxID=191504 RepID=A0AAV5DY39_ELECO|nr:hypothetical protein PR202_gb02386 [Eleusine coracana subsp. coracana]